MVVGSDISLNTSTPLSYIQLVNPQCVKFRAEERLEAVDRHLATVLAF